MSETPPRPKNKTRILANRRIVGWREWVGLPDLGVDAIKAKIDTGARSSALHVFDIEPFTLDGRAMVRFVVATAQRTRKGSIPAEAEQIDERVVRSSGGHEQQRRVILTHLTWGGETWPIELTLTRRDEMGFRLLIGRQALRKRLLVDPGRSFLGRPSHAPSKPHGSEKPRKTS